MKRERVILTPNLLKIQQEQQRSGEAWGELYFVNFAGDLSNSEDNKGSHKFKKTPMKQSIAQGIRGVAFSISIPIGLTLPLLGLLAGPGLTLPPAPTVQAQIFPDITTPFAQRILWAEFLISVGLVEDGLRIYEEEIEALLLRRDYLRAVEFTEGLAAQFYYRGQTDLALRYYHRTQALHSITPQLPPHLVHQLAQALGAVYQNQGEWQAAADLYTATLKQPADPFSTATTLFDQGRLQHRQGQLTAALATYEQAIAQYQAVDGAGGEQLPVLNAIALIDQAQGHPTKAQARYQEALSLAARVTEPRLRVMYQIMTLDNLAPTAEDARQRAALIAAEGDPGRYWSDAPNVGPLGLGLVMVQLGKFYLDLDQGERAEAYFTEALAVAEQSYNTGYDPLTIIGQVVTIYTQVGQPERAIPYQAKAIAITQGMQLPENSATALQRLGTLQRDAGQYAAALTTYRTALTTYEEAAALFSTNHLADQAVVWAAMGEVYRRQGDDTAAAAAYEQAFTTYDNIPLLIPQIAVLEQWATVDPVRRDDLLRQVEILRQHPDLQGPNRPEEEKARAKQQVKLPPRH